MSEAFTGELRIFGFTFAPLNWATCNGQIMAIQQNTALFSILGTTYGGDGIRTFGLPNLGGNVCVGAGANPALSPYLPGETGGATQVTLTIPNTPAHTHAFGGLSFRTPAETYIPGPTQSFAKALGCKPYLPATPAPTLVAMAPESLTPFVGGGVNVAAHNNLMPTIAMNYCLCTSGIFPSRN